MPKVSVAIPTYNRARFLAECIESILKQTFQDFEILLIDDGSTDNTSEIVSAYCPPVKYFRQENKGAPTAYNKGITEAIGDYVWLVDSDDVLLEDALELGVEVLDRWPKVGFVYGQAYVIDEEGHMMGLCKPSHSKESYVRSGREEIKHLMLENYVSGSTAMFRRSCFDVVGLFNPVFHRGSEDYDLCVRFAKKYDVAYIDRPVAKYRVHRSCLTADRQVEEKKRAHDLILQSIFDDNELGHVYSDLRAKAYYYHYCRVARTAISAGDVKAARSYLIKALRTYPQAAFRMDSMKWQFLLAKAVLPAPFIDFARSVKRRLNILSGRKVGIP